MSGAVYIVHHVDTEGPLYEGLDELFKRLHLIFCIDLEPTPENLRKLQNREMDLGPIADEVAKVVDPHTVGMLGDWPSIDEMLDRAMSMPFRNELVDSARQGWVYNWHCMDHSGFEANPRRRDLGHFKVFDHYQNRIKNQKTLDALHWHFHPIGFDKAAHIPATSYTNSFPVLNQIISQRLLERGVFPLVNRAGFHAERPDSHWFLEQWIPFDPSNLSVPEDALPSLQQDMAGGRFGDWRRAPTDWSIYHPHHDDYQSPGQCRRVIARVLNMKSRHRNISVSEIEKAFKKAAQGEKVYLGITNHDWRDMVPEIQEFRDMLKQVIGRYPKTPFYFSEAAHAFQKILYSESEVKKEAVTLKAQLLKQVMDRALLSVEVVNGKTFGPQPWLAFQTKDGRVFHDNMDIVQVGRSFSYTFDNYTFAPEHLNKIAVATNDKFGNQSIVQINCR